MANRPKSEGMTSFAVQARFTRKFNNDGNVLTSLWESFRDVKWIPFMDLRLTKLENHEQHS